MFRRRTMALFALALVACEDFPTEAPMWEQTWAVPGEDIEIGVAEFLPASVEVTADGSAFQTTVPGTTIDLTLGEMCADCAALDGTTAPKPAFTHTHTTTSSLPSSVVSVTLTGGQFGLRLAHSLSFDPLRPSADPSAERGHLVIEISSAGAVVGRDSISGDDTAFGPGSVLTPTLPVQEADAGNVLDIALTIFSPEGDDTAIETSDTVGVRIEPALVEFSSATIVATDLSLAAPATALEFEAVDATLIERVRSGALRLDVANPFDVEGTLDLDFDLGTEVITKSIPLVPGPSVAMVEFTGEQIRGILGAGTVDVSALGSAAAPDGTITVQPGDALIMESQFQLVVLVGGSEGGN